MHTTLSRLFVLMSLMIVLLSCNQKTDNRAPERADTARIAALIAKGKKMRNGQADSLPEVVKALMQQWRLTGNARALVYGQLYNAHQLWMAARHSESMTEAVHALSDIRKFHVDEAYPDVYALIANLHKENTNYKMAFEANKSAYDWAVTNRDTNAIIAQLSLKAMLTHTIRKTRPDSMPDTSINIQIRALRLAETSPEFEKVRIPLYDNIGQYYKDNGDYDKAISYAGNGAALAEKYHQDRSLTYAYAWLGQAWFYKGDEAKGLNYLNRALSIAKKLKQPYREMEIYGHLADCYRHAREFEKTLQLTQRSQRMRDSLQVRQNEVKMSELQLKYDIVEKDKDIAVMGKQQAVKNRQLIVVVASAVLIMIFSVLLYLQYRATREDNRLKNLSNVQKDRALENIAFIQAHELRRPLASIMGLINVIRASGHQVDEETLDKLSQAGDELDKSIKSIITHVEEEARG